MEKEISFLVALWDASPVLGTLLAFCIVILYMKKFGIWGEPKEDPEFKDMKKRVSEQELKIHNLELNVAVLLDWKNRDDK